MVGIDRRTGARLTDLDSTIQAVVFILATRLASVVLLREFGGGVVELLGRSISVGLFLAWRQLIATAIDLWEPRLRVRRVSATGSVEEIRRGTAHLIIEADYRPNALRGDFRVARVVNLNAVFGNSTVTVTL